MHEVPKKYFFVIFQTFQSERKNFVKFILGIQKVNYDNNTSSMKRQMLYMLI